MLTWQELKANREKAGLSQMALARLSGVGPGVIFRIEKGLRGVDATTSETLERAIREAVALGFGDKYKAEMAARKSRAGNKQLREENWGGRGFAPEKLREARETKGYSKSELAWHADVSTASVMKWETGALTPSWERLLVVAEALEQPVDFFLRPAEDAEDIEPWEKVILAALPDEKVVSLAKRLLARKNTRGAAEFTILRPAMTINVGANLNRESTKQTFDMSTTPNASSPHDGEQPLTTAC